VSTYWSHKLRQNFGVRILNLVIETKAVVENKKLFCGGGVEAFGCTEQRRRRVLNFYSGDIAFRM